MNSSIEQMKDNALETTGAAAEGVAIGSLIAAPTGMIVAYGDFIFNVIKAAATDSETMLDKVGQTGLLTAGLGLVAITAAGAVGRITDRLRGVTSD